ncbi:hypothetical protein [Arcobacter porcinus]|uniref:Uncharacterized protein n=1 Tax=Arcobacter porcinus TaxID=1935204 RepID=A0ABX2YDG0_9BACT|nr:hypothetical protein [Arcobacter porcinus]OCL93024.1 hypothetical protein AAX28_00564 [Arcobacter porcinus]
MKRILLIFLFSILLNADNESEKSTLHHFLTKEQTKEEKVIGELQRYINKVFNIKNVENCNNRNEVFRIGFEVKNKRIFFYKVEYIEDKYINEFIIKESGKTHDFLEDLEIKNQLFIIRCD